MVNESKIKVNGIDVSTWQGAIDWPKVKADGIGFAMLRLGFGSANGDRCVLDNCFEKNVAGATAAGVNIGCYFYSYAASVEAAKKEAAFVIETLSRHKGKFTYPIAFDIEDGSQAGLGREKLTDMVIAFGDAIEKAGYYFSVYANLNWFTNLLNDSRLIRFDHWLAQWASAPTYNGEIGIWQTSSSGAVAGINGSVDMNIAYKDYPAIIRENGLNGFAAGSQPVEPAPKPVETPKPAPNQEDHMDIDIGAVVKIASGAVYYNGGKVPDWVISKRWIVEEVAGDRVVINHSEDGQNAIASPIHRKYLTVAGKQETVYTVKLGDSLWSIATAYGTTVDKLAAYNKVTNPSLIFVGQKIRIPG